MHLQSFCVIFCSVVILFFPVSQFQLCSVNFATCSFYVALKEPIFCFLIFLGPLVCFMSALHDRVPLCKRPNVCSMRTSPFYPLQLLEVAPS